VTYSTYFGGGGEDVVTGIAVDDAGFIYFTGTTPTFGVTPMYPSTPDAYQPVSAGGSETFVTKLSPDGRTIIYSTFFGGPFTDTAHAIAVDRHGRVYIAGTTGGLGFPIVNPVQPTCAGREDAFVAKFN